ncbi:bifunctional diguanylate cyclase/phosphodiesterase [Phenylobacterium sp.]|uniref:putative bifunctional diguanylate cyclase/phosphodiesterase n=1 Tax=Phenylobacterium sp. TaxID=1871053 RepID=UPI002732E0E6|nr:GGDEF domain-containing phosphodiesterase [Phenylobacterium sp.]MDP3854187.1 GGDEF domain-containing phosphodiesterase [Phenylobacterium sp.]
MKLWTYGTLGRLPLIGFRGKVLALAAIAVAFPLIGWLIPGEGAARTATLAVAIAGAATALTLLTLMLRPLGLLGRALEACANGEEAPALPQGFTDGVGRMMRDVTKIAGRLDSQRHRLSNRHPITDLPTREPFLASLDADIKDLTHTVVLGVVRFADYDRLAAFDQGAAERALAAFAQRLSSALQPNRVVAQVDRDCFAIWFAQVEAPHVAANELQALSYVLGQELPDIRLSPDVDLGAAIFPHDGEDPATLLTRAFAALPKAGETSNGKLAFFSAQSSDTAKERFSLEQDLRYAIAREQFALHFQPVVNLETGRVVGAEALLRWKHPDLGMVSPAEFIPILEQSGLIDEVGLWVLNAACREARAWQDLGLNGLKMAVNLSARQFADPSLNTTIVRTLERHRLSPSALEVELTETAAMEDAARTRRLVEELRALGVSVAIDDFGAGYSSLSYLKNLPFSKLKIDREFVTKIDERRDSQAICRALVELSRGLDIQVLAEGAETREEVETLRSLGCFLIQGFYFARPMSGEDFVRTVRDPAWLARLAPPPRPPAKRRAVA